MAARNLVQSDPVVEELAAIKRLLIFGLMKNGASQSEVAKALGVDQSKISRMFSKPTAARTRRARG